MTGVQTCALPISFASTLNKIVFFGDSLSDDGNLYSVLKIVPKSPPYFAGRFTNGITWAEHVGNYYYNKNYDGYQIYAVGGATAMYHNLTTDSFIPPTVIANEINSYLFKTIFSDRKNTLYAIWIGANDYLYEQSEDIDGITRKVVDKISWSINTLIDQGGHDFLILNLPDFASIPYAKKVKNIDHLHQFAVAHNQKLAQAVTAIQQAHPDVKILLVDIYSIFNDVLNNVSKYNLKYHKHLSNLTEACWKGTVLDLPLNASLENEKNVLKMQLQKSITHTKDPLVNTANLDQLTNFILNSPSIKESYQVGKMFSNGMMPCENASEHLFWDDIHPSEVTHEILGNMVIEALNSAGIM